eukprot:637183-Prorocentrum_minimum.AAC.1
MMGRLICDDLVHWAKTYKVRSQGEDRGQDVQGVCTWSHHSRVISRHSHVILASSLVILTAGPRCLTSYSCHSRVVSRHSRVVFRHSHVLLASSHVILAHDAARLRPPARGRRIRQVDGFRFDLMGHIMLRTMEEAKARLAALTVEEDGVDGSKLYLYGEGWDFAEVYNNRVGVNASQTNLAGTGRAPHGHYALSTPLYHWKIRFSPQSF